VRILLEAGADPNTRIIINGRQELFIFPLHLAISKKSDKMVKLLIEHGAGLELRQADGATGLLNAIRLNEGKIALTLLRAGAPFSSMPGIQQAWSCPALQWAIKDSQPRAVQMLIEEGADLELKDSDGLTALQVAMWRNERKVVLTLLRAGA
ncbi:hypothetical protein AURANDRAFT_5402, partial [Aureococcus anophagefferens]